MSLTREEMISHVNRLCVAGREIDRLAEELYEQLKRDTRPAGDFVAVPRATFDAMIERLQFCLDTFGPIQDHGSEAADLDDWRALSSFKAST